MSKYKGKRVLVVGFGRSGVAVARYMCKQGAKVTVTDMKQKSELSESVNTCGDCKIEYEFGRHSSKTFTTAELIVVSPGVPLNIKPLEEAKEAKVPITNEIELAASALKEPLIAVTGTNGKTTTTTLIGEMFKADGKNAYVGGNIGKPLLDYFTDNHKCDVVIAELSSFQLELTQRLIPAVAVFTNLEEDHLDRYPDMESYVIAKKRLLTACDKNSYVVLNHDSRVIANFSNDNPGKLIWFTKKNPITVGGDFSEQFLGVYYSANPNRQIISKMTGKDEVYDLSQFRLFGEHNRENLMAAICAARAVGVSPKAIQTVINTFKGVPHRLEFVRKKDGVFFFNDSKGTNVMSVQRSLASFNNPIILIAGGKDKGMDFAPLADLVKEKCKILILLGEAKEKINRAIGDFAETYLVGTFEEAILLAYQKSRSGDIILLSPGCASYDMFRNYEERGDYFKKLVAQL